MNELDKHPTHPGDDHLGCPSWPNCDEAPRGCRKIYGNDVEFYGHKDIESKKNNE